MVVGFFRRSWAAVAAWFAFCSLSVFTSFGINLVAMMEVSMGLHVDFKLVVQLAALRELVDG